MKKLARPSPSARNQGLGMGLSYRPRVKITGKRSISASKRIVQWSSDEIIVREKDLDFFRGHFNILAGLQAPTHTVTDACQ